MSNSPLRNIDEAYFCAMVKQFRNYGHDYTSGMMPMYFKSTVNLEIIIYAIPTQTVDGMKVLIDGCGLVLLNGLYLGCSFETFPNDYGI